VNIKFKPRTELLLSFNFNWSKSIGSFYFWYTVTKAIYYVFSVSTNFRTWTTDVASSTFCPDGSKACVNAKLAQCQDRTIQCLDPLPDVSGLIKKDITDNSTLNSHSLGAKFSYTCQTKGFTKLDLKTYFFCNSISPL
jgi:hypothetical protein